MSEGGPVAQMRAMEDGRHDRGLEGMGWALGDADAWVGARTHVRSGHGLIGGRRDGQVAHREGRGQCGGGICKVRMAHTYCICSMRPCHGSMSVHP